MKLALDQKPINQTTHDKRGSFDDKILEYAVHYRDYYKVLRLNFATKKEKNIKVIIAILKKLIKKSDKSNEFSIVKLNGHHFLRYRSVRELLKLENIGKICNFLYLIYEKITIFLIAKIPRMASLCR